MVAVDRPEPERAVERDRRAVQRLDLEERGARAVRRAEAKQLGRDGPAEPRTARLGKRGDAAQVEPSVREAPVGRLP